MKTFCLILLAVVGSFSSFAQPYAAGKRTITIVDQQRNNRAIATDIYYPANVAGNNTAIASGTEKFPVIVFGHGFVIGTASYKWLGDSLASNGFIAAFPNTEGSISPDHAAFGRDLSIVCTKIVEFDVDATSPFFGRVLNKGAIGGHSMGGGAGFLAASYGNTNIKALFNLAAAETNPSATAAAALINVPTLIFSGSRDCIVPAATQLNMFNNIPTGICKAYINLSDALHCHFANNNGTCAFGQFFSGCNASPKNTTQVFSETISLLVPFLNYHLKTSCADGNLFENNFNTMPATSKILTCSLIPACGPLPVNLLYFKGIYSGKEILLTWKTSLSVNSKYFELQKSIDGQNFETFATLSTNSNADLYNARDKAPVTGINFYRLKMIDNDNSFRYSSIINVRSHYKKISVNSIYPNPVKDIIQVKLNAFSNTKTSIQLLDFSGMEISSKWYSVTEGNSVINVDASALKAGVFMMVLKSTEGEILGTFKLVKL